MELEAYLQYAQGRFEKGDEFHQRAASLLTHYPVSIREFVQSPDYLGDTSMYEKNLDALEELNNPGGMRMEAPTPKR